MIQRFVILAFVILLNHTAFAQDSYLKAKSEADDKTYTGSETYQVKKYNHEFKSKAPKNVIFMIGDGMGVAHISAGLTANRGNLYLENFKKVGFSRTQSADNYTTDSAAGGTALSTGVKTYNGAIGVDVNKKTLKTILEAAEEKGLSTGLVSTSAITHATPASFIAHQPDRDMYEEIAADFLKTDPEVIIGGGLNHFSKRKDGRNLLEEFRKKGYTVDPDFKKAGAKANKLVSLTADVHTPRITERKDMLPAATETAVNILSKNKKGFFLMVEGSQIDWGGHAGNTVYIVEDMLDFDQAIGKALDFASRDGETLIVITADHETGGMAILDGDFKSGMVKGSFPTGGHTGILVPVFAYGPGADEFTGIMENTDIHKKMEKLLLK